MSEEMKKENGSVATAPEQEKQVDVRKPVVSPATEVRETEQAYIVRCDVPGADEKSVQITLEDGVLSIEAEQADRGPVVGNVLFAEFEPCVYRRVFTLRRGVDVNGIVARVKHGVLTVTLPKPPEHQPIRISVVSGE